MASRNAALRIRSLGRCCLFTGVFVLLGSAGGGRVLADGSLQWMKLFPTPLDRYGLVYDTARDKVVMFGGERQMYYDNETWEWDWLSWKQRAVTGPSKRKGYAMAYDSHRNVTVYFGGENSSGFQNDTWEYDGISWTQRLVSGPEARGYPVMAFDSRRNVVVLFGGRFLYGIVLVDTWEYDGVSWTRRATSGPPLVFGRMDYDSKRGVCVFFGGMDQYSHYTNQIWEWDGTSWVQKTPSGDVPSPRGAHAMTYDVARGEVLVFGGQGGSYPVYGHLGDTWSWNGTIWRQLSIDGPSPRCACAMAFDSNRALAVLVGGYSEKGECGETWAWNGTNWTLLHTTGPPPIGIPYETMVFDSVRGTSLVFTTGWSSSGYYPSTWEFTNSVWTLRSTTGPPMSAYRSGWAMAYDNWRGRAVLFGGTDYVNNTTVYLNDTWEWNGGSWVQVPVTGPPARTGHAMTFDADRGVTVLFGGKDASAKFGDAWEWDGISWSQKATTGPCPRYSHVMSYDAGRNVTVLFGGYDTAYLNDTWEWNGTSWTQSTVSGPPGRTGTAMAYDSDRAVTVLFGGWGSSGLLAADTWMYDGAAWTQSNLTGPSARQGHAMAYDANLHRLVLFGGFNGNLQAALFETWVLGYPPPWIATARSVRSHGSAGMLGIEVVAGRGVECRQGGPQNLSVTFTEDVFGQGGLDPGDVTLSSGTVNDVSITGSELSVDLSGVADGQRLYVSFPGIVGADGQITPDVLDFVVMAGDVNANGRVDGLDVAALRACFTGAEVTVSDQACLNRDLDCDGDVDLSDFGLLQGSLTGP